MSINTYPPLKEKKKIQAFCYYIFAQNSNLIHSNKLNIDFFFPGLLYFRVFDFIFLGC